MKRIDILEKMIADNDSNLVSLINDYLFSSRSSQTYNGWNLTEYKQVKVKSRTDAMAQLKSLRNNINDDNVLGSQISMIFNYEFAAKLLRLIDDKQLEDE